VSGILAQVPASFMLASYTGWRIQGKALGAAKGAGLLTQKKQSNFYIHSYPSFKKVIPMVAFPEPVRGLI